MGIERSAAPTLPELYKKRMTAQQNAMALAPFANPLAGPGAVQSFAANVAPQLPSPVSNVDIPGLAGAVAGFGSSIANVAMQRPIRELEREQYRGQKRALNQQEADVEQDFLVNQGQLLEDTNRARGHAQADLAARGMTDSGAAGMEMEDLDRALDQRMWALAIERTRAIRGIQEAQRLAKLQHKARSAHQKIQNIGTGLGLAAQATNIVSGLGGI